MALITLQQAEDMYDIAKIFKVTQDSDPTIGHWAISFNYDGFPYSYDADYTVLPMDATDQEIKDKFIEIAQTQEYKGVFVAQTQSEVNKV